MEHKDKTARPALAESKSTHRGLILKHYLRPDAPDASPETLIAALEHSIARGERGDTRDFNEILMTQIQIMDALFTHHARKATEDRDYEPMQTARALQIQKQIRQSMQTWAQLCKKPKKTQNELNKAIDSKRNPLESSGDIPGPSA